MTLQLRLLCKLSGLKFAKNDMNQTNISTQKVPWSTVREHSIECEAQIDCYCPLHSPLPNNLWLNNDCLYSMAFPFTHMKHKCNLTRKQCHTTKQIWTLLSQKCNLSMQLKLHSVQRGRLKINCRSLKRKFLPTKQNNMQTYGIAFNCHPFL